MLLLAFCLSLVFGGEPLNPLQQHQVVQAHNFWRNEAAQGKTGASGKATKMLTMYWSDKLAANAQKWGERCVWGHSAPVPKSQWNPPNNIKYYGENLGVTQGMKVDLDWISKRVKSWVNEYKDFDHETLKCTPGKMCGHYTQVVWDKSYAVGCAIVHCKDMQNTFSPGDYFVCMYLAAGNVNARFNPPFKTGSKAGSNCDPKYTKIPLLSGSPNSAFPALCNNDRASAAKEANDAKTLGFGPLPGIPGLASKPPSGGGGIPSLSSSPPSGGGGIPSLSSSPPSGGGGIPSLSSSPIGIPTLSSSPIGIPSLSSSPPSDSPAEAQPTSGEEGKPENEDPTLYSKYATAGIILSAVVLCTCLVVCIICQLCCKSGGKVSSSRNVGEQSPAVHQVASPGPPLSPNQAPLSPLIPASPNLGTVSQAQPGQAVGQPNFQHMQLAPAAYQYHAVQDQHHAVQGKEGYSVQMHH